MLRSISKANNKSWDEYVPYKCSYRITKIPPFKAMYGFNPLTPMYLIPLPTSFDFVHKEGVSKSNLFKKLHERVNTNMQQKKKNSYAKYNNKGKIDDL